MPIGRSTIVRTTANGPFAYTFSDDPRQLTMSTVVTGKTLAQAYSEVGALAQALPGSIQSVTITVVSA